MITRNDIKVKNNLYQFIFDKKNKPGVYIIFFDNKKYFYFGSSNKCSHRINQHMCAIKKNKHNNSFLMNVCKKYKNNIKFCFLYTDTRQDALIIEQDLINKFYYNNKYCLNQSSNATVPKHSTEGRKRLSDLAKERHKNNTFNRKKITEYHRSFIGKQMHSMCAKKQRENPNYTKQLTNIIQEKLKKFHNIKLISPLGKEQIIGWNYRDFCRNHNLDCSNLRKVINKKQKHHKGWRLA